jgi:DNA-binding transcriptional ArsR family regulator
MVTMNSGLASLYKILKDETRKRVIILLHEKESLSYTDLTKALGITSTGKMNYHLKILDDLLTKTEDGKYTLTETGKLAARLLQEFPEKSQSQIEAPLPRALFVGAGLLSAVYAVLVVGLYFMDYLDFAGLVTSIFWAVAAVILLVIIGKARERRAEWSPRRQMLAAKLSIMFAGAVGGVVVGFFGGGLLLRGLITLTGSRGVSLSVDSFLGFAFWVLNPVIGSVLGGFVGYLIYKRSRFAKATYFNPFA